MATTTSPDTVVLLNQQAGIALIPKPTPLTRLNYFDGKFLRASDLTSEQDYHRRLQQLAASANAMGVVHGFDLQQLAGDQLELGAGLAIDAEGRVLYLPMDAAVQIEELIRRSSKSNAHILQKGAAGSAVFALCESAAVTDAVVAPVAGNSLYVIGISLAEALCGQEDVFGQPCASSCAGGTERPQRLEGVVLRALPLRLASPLPESKAETMQSPLHLRSRVASAWFADESKQVESLISGAGLLSSLWCRGAPPAAGGFVPLAVLARAGGHTVFLDAWTARRERMGDGTPKRYWQQRMAMRPWDAYLAQILQFQCQLRDAWTRTPDNNPDDPCQDLRRAVVEVGDLLTRLDKQYQASAEKLVARDAKAGMLAAAAPIPISRTLLDGAIKRAGAVRGTLLLQPTERVLIKKGIVELPPAGYLPVSPGSAFPVNEQVRRLMGEGVDLRFCVVRPDYVPHALEEAQHMERISLLRGLDNPQSKEQVDILVPDGQILNGANSQGAAWEVRLASTAKTDLILATKAQRNVMTGAARSERAGSDGALSFFFAGLVETASRDAALTALKAWAGERDNGLEQTLWRSVALNRETEVESSKEPTPTEMASRATALREEAVAYRLKSLQRVASTATTSGIRHFEGTDTKQASHTALWLSLKSEADPLAVAEGGRVDMSMDLSLISPKSTGTEYVDIGIVGAQLIIDSRVASGQRVTVQGTLKGAAIIAGLVGTLANAQRGLQFSAPVIITSEPSDEGRSLRVEVDFSGLLFDGRGFMALERLGVRVLTADEGKAAFVQLEMSAQGVDLDLGAKLTRRDDAIKLGSPLRAASETAIDVIATRESAPNFAVEARADLFGQRKAVREDAISVRATKDWVLFHRRRAKDCGAAPTAAPVEARRYELHHLKAKGEEQLRQARAAVLAANASSIRKLGFAPIGAVAFEGGRSSLATATAALLEDWQQAEPGTRLRFGAIGSQGAAQAEGESLAQARLAGLELVLMQQQLDRALENQVLPQLPALGLAGWDGAIFLITEDVITVCHDVYSLADAAELKSFMTLAKRSGLPAAMEKFKPPKLAHADYGSEGRALSAASADAIKQAWGDQGPAGPQAVVYRTSTVTDAAAAQRTTAVTTLLGTPTAKVQVLTDKDHAQVSDCVGISFVLRPQREQPPPPPPPEVKVDQVLLGFALWRDGSFVINADTPALTSFKFTDFKPDDASTYEKLFGTLLNRQPNGLTVCFQKGSDQADALTLKPHGDGLIVKFGYQEIKVSNVQQLGEKEILAIEARGHARGTWRFAVIENTRV